MMMMYHVGVLVAVDRIHVDHCSDLIIFLSSLKKNRKATFDVLFWGVLYSAFFVSMMEWGSRI